MAMGEKDGQGQAGEGCDASPTEVSGMGKLDG